MERMWLIGMMGSGKSTVGHEAADRVGEPFHDTDLIVSDRSGMPIPMLFETIGVAAFRDLERQAVETVATARGIIATGGGVVLDPQLRDLMSRTGTVVHLAAPLEVLATRLGAGFGRPLIEGGDTLRTLSAIAAEREHLYSSIADVSIETGELDRGAVVDMLEMLWNRS